MFSIFDGRDRFYQWDTGRKLIVEDDTITQVHFANCLCPDATVCEVSNGVVNVPDTLLTQYMDIRVWGYDGEMTKYEQVIEVEKRTKPSDYIYTPEEVKTWEALTAQIKQLETLLNSVSETANFASNKAIDLTDRVDGLESRVQTCEEWLGIGGGPGPGDCGDIWIGGTPFWIDYPMTFEEMLGSMNSISFDTCPACGSDFSHITIDYDNYRVLWRDNCGESGDNIAYLTQYEAPVSPYQTVWPGDSFEVVYENVGPGPGEDYITINDSITYDIVSGMTFRQMISEPMFLNECSGCHNCMVSAFDVGADNRVYFYEYCSDCQPGPPGYLTHYISNEPVSADEPIYSGAMFNLVWD